MKTNGKEILIHIVSEKYATKHHRTPVMRIVQKQLLVLNRNLQPEIFTGEHLKTHSGIPHQINNSKGWYQNVPFGGGVLKPRYKFEGLKKHVANDLNFVQDVVAIVQRFKLC